MFIVVLSHWDLGLFVALVSVSCLIQCLTLLLTSWSVSPAHGCHSFIQQTLFEQLCAKQAVGMV